MESVIDNHCNISDHFALSLFIHLPCLLDDQSVVPTISISSLDTDCLFYNVPTCFELVHLSDDLETAHFFEIWYDKIHAAPMLPVLKLKNVVRTHFLFLAYHSLS